MKRFLTILCLLTVLLGFAFQQASAQDIYAAIEEGDLGKVREYLDRDPGLLNLKNQDLLTPLNLAAERDRPEIAALLLERGADPSIGDRENSQPIHLAAVSGSIRVLDLLLAQGVDIDARDINLMTPLLFAASRGQLEMTAHLINNNANLKAESSTGLSAIHFAAISGNADLVRLLVGKGARIDARTDRGFTPLHIAASYGRTDVVTYLVQSGADISAESDEGAQPLAWAVGRNSYDAASFLASKGADVNHRDKDGFTALHDAAGRGNTRVTQLLLDNGADVNASGTNGMVPLAYAAWADNAAEMGRLLILNGADVNPDPCENNKACTCGPNFNTPLHMACQMGKPELAKVLVDNGAKVNRFNAEGQTPMHCAVKSGDLEIVKCLADHGAFLNVPEKQQGMTELHFAAAMGYDDIVKLLTERGSAPDVKDREGRTPMDYAFYYGQDQSGYMMLADGGEDGKIGEYVNRECPLKKQLSSGEAMVWYLGHSGWAIKTSNHFLLFDYFDDTRARKPGHPCLESGCIVPQELEGQPLTVFCSHGHTDHYNPSVFNWKQEIPEAKYVMCFQPEQVKDDYMYVPVHSEADLDGMKIYSTGSTDQGGGFLVEADGLVIYHMGDHANREDELAEAFTKEIGLVAARHKDIDIVFGPIRGCSLGTPEQVKAGIYYALETLQPALFVPMHSGGYSLEYRKFAEQAVRDGLTVPMKYAVNRGDRFHYLKGEPVAERMQE